jgi:hypothetical protein
MKAAGGPALATSGASSTRKVRVGRAAALARQHGRETLGVAGETGAVLGIVQGRGLVFPRQQNRRPMRQPTLTAPGVTEAGTPGRRASRRHPTAPPPPSPTGRASDHIRRTRPRQTEPSPHRQPQRPASRHAQREGLPVRVAAASRTYGTTHAAKVPAPRRFRRTKGHLHRSEGAKTWTSPAADRPSRLSGEAKAGDLPSAYFPMEAAGQGYRPGGRKGLGRRWREPSLPSHGRMFEGGASALPSWGEGERGGLPPFRMRWWPVDPAAIALESKQRRQAAEAACRWPNRISPGRGAVRNRSPCRRRPH